MNEEDYKQVMFSKTEGFWRIVYQLQAEIAFLWTEGNIEGTYSRIKHLYAFVCSHFKEEKVDFMEKFKEIEKIIYDPSNQRFTTLAKIKKLANYRKADELMFSLYIELKKHMKDSDMELYYGVPKEIINRQRRDSNILKVFGRNNE